MIFEKIVIGVLLSFWPYVVKCQDDASIETRESNLSRAGTGFEPRRFVDDGIDDILDNRNMPATDYQNFAIDEHRLARDIDSVESNVNVNVNGLSASRLPWNEPRSWRPNRRPGSSTKFGRNGGNGFNRIMRLLHQMPNSNIDYTFAHPDGHVRVQRRRNSRRKLFRETPSEDDTELTRTGGTGNQCQPIVLQALQYLRLIEQNLRNWENDLMTFVNIADYEL